MVESLYHLVMHWDLVLVAYQLLLAQPSMSFHHNQMINNLTVQLREGVEGAITMAEVEEGAEVEEEVTRVGEAGLLNLMVEGNQQNQRRRKCTTLKHFSVAL